MSNQIRIPDELVKAAARGECIAFLGAGASREAGAPLWSQLIDELIRFARERGGISACDAKLLRQGRDRRGPEETAAIVRRRIKKAHFRSFMDHHFRRDLGEPTAVHRAVVRGPFRAVFTTNYDCLIERAYEQAHSERPRVLTWQQMDDALAAEMQGEFCVVKLHGCVEHLDSIILTSSEFTDLVLQQRYTQFLTSHFVLRSLLFVGYSISDEDTRTLLKRVQKMFPLRNTTHFLLVPAAETDRLTREQETEEFGVEFVPYKQHTDVPSFLRRLTSRARRTRPRETARTSRVLRLERGMDRLASALAWQLVDGVSEEGVRAYVFSERRGRTVTRIALSDLKGGLTASRATRAAAMACRFGCDETFVLVDRPPSEDIRDIVTTTGAICLEPHDLVMRAVNLLEYASRLTSDRDLAELDQRYVQPDFEAPIGESALGRNLDDYVLQWLLAPECWELWVLGDFGTGKTWFSRHFARLLASKKLEGIRCLPTPIIVPLRQIRGVTDVYGLIQPCLARRWIGLAAGKDTLDWVMNHGMLALILDGADECRDAIFQARQVAGAHTKVIITCRTHYFDSLAEYQRALGIPRTSLNVVELKGFDDDALAEAIRARYPRDGDKRQAELGRWPELWDMAHRPLFLDMILRSLGRATLSDAPTVADVYDRYVTSALRTRPVGSMRRALRAALEQLARKGQEQERRATQFSRDEVLDAILGASAKRRRSAVYEALHAGSVLVRNPSDLFEFGHLSFQEYFAATSLAREGKEGMETLCRHVADHDWREVCWFYASIQGRKALPVVDACLRQAREDPQCLFLAARMLQAARQQKNRRARELCEALVRLFKGKSAQRGRESDRARESWYVVTERVYDSLRRLPAAAKRTLRRQMGASDPLVRRRAVLTMFHVFEHEAFGEVARHLDPAKEEDEHVRWHAAEALSEAAEQGDLATLLKYARKANDKNDRYVIIRGNVLWAHSRHGYQPPPGLPPFDTNLLDRLHRTVANSRVSRDVRAHGALLLGRCANALGVSKRRKAEIGELLSGLLKKRTDWRGYVARALGELGWKDGTVPLCRYIETSGDDEIWLRYAVDAVEKLAQPISRHIAAIDKAARGLPDQLRHLRSRLEACAAQLRADRRARRARKHPNVGDDRTEMQQCETPPA